MARLSEYDRDLCKEICERVSLGEHIKSVLDRVNSSFTGANDKEVSQGLFFFFVLDFLPSFHSYFFFFELF